MSLFTARMTLLDLLVKRTEEQARRREPWRRPPVTWERIRELSPCTCCAVPLGTRRFTLRAEPSDAAVLKRLDLLLPSTQREIRREKERARRRDARVTFEDRILRVFAEQGDGLRVEEIASAMGEGRGKVRVALGHLARAGRMVNRAEEGWFRRGFGDDDGA